MPDQDEWPFDADRADPLTALRIPVIRALDPDWRYVVCLAVSGPGAPWKGLRPDSRELQQILAELGYRMSRLSTGRRQVMRNLPLDVDDWVNTLILQKSGPDDWRYRHAGSMGPAWPLIGSGERLALDQLLDHIHSIGGEPGKQWEEHKAKHPEAFGGKRS